jgi:hypothetical protein
MRLIFFLIRLQFLTREYMAKKKSNKKKISLLDPQDDFCYVMVSCKKPSCKGEMEVSMTYKGDLLLASYLIQGAQNLIDEKMEASLQSPESLEG